MPVLRSIKAMPHLEPLPLELGFGPLSGDCALNQAVWIGLRGEDGGVFASILQAFVPAQI